MSTINSKEAMVAMTSKEAMVAVFVKWKWLQRLKWRQLRQWLVRKQ